jgi:NADH-quinone oxidoreductase subunit A
MAEQFLPVLIALLLAVLTATALLGLAALLATRSRQGTPGGRSTYESGVPLLDESHKRIPVKFYLVALVFVVLDVEVAFLYPWAVTYRELLATYSTAVLWDMLAFMALLALAYVYLWRTGVFDWGRRKQFARRGGDR